MSDKELFLGNIKGPKGDPGPEGPRGPAGPVGPSGGADFATDEEIKSVKDSLTYVSPIRIEDFTFYWATMFYLNNLTDEPLSGVSIKYINDLTEDQFNNPEKYLDLATLSKDNITLNVGTYRNSFETPSGEVGGLEGDAIVYILLNDELVCYQCDCQYGTKTWNYTGIDPIEKTTRPDQVGEIVKAGIALVPAPDIVTEEAAGIVPPVPSDETKQYAIKMAEGSVTWVEVEATGGETVEFATEEDIQAVIESLKAGE